MGFILLFLFYFDLVAFSVFADFDVFCFSFFIGIVCCGLLIYLFNYVGWLFVQGESYLDQIEESIYEDVDRCHLFKVLRLLCLQSLTTGGIRSNKLDLFRRLIAQTYGFEELFTITNLEKCGMCVCLSMGVCV